MSIRLKTTLLYNAILAITLVIFGVALYSVQAQITYESLKNEVMRASETLGTSVLKNAVDPNPDMKQQPDAGAPPPMPFQTFSNDKAFDSLHEREIVRVLDISGNLVASPFGRQEDALPLSEEGLQALQSQQEWWETDTVQDQRMLIYSRPITSKDNVTYILQVARPLTERDNSLQSLSRILIAASLVTLLAAFGIGWIFSGYTLSPIHRITQTASAIGEERDFTRRVSYHGPQDEVGQLATTFNAMLARLEDAYQRVAHSLEMQRDFVADVSHELRTPLTTLRGNLGLLRRQPPIPQAEQADILNDMVDESDRLIRLVNDLLVLARADTGRNQILEPTAIFPILEETCHQARQMDSERDITLNASPNLSIIGNRDSMKQVMLILLDNAIKHSEGDIIVTANRQSTQVEVRVQDYGQGIAPDKLDHVFDRFYRCDDETTIPGFGLGLAIAKSLVEAQSGTIMIESELGKGSTVIMHFPYENL